MRLFATLLLACTVQGLVAQNVGIGTATPNASAKLEIVDANRGFLFPRVSLTATNVAAPVTAPANWLVVFNTVTAGTGATAVTPGLYYWDNTALLWVRIQTSNDAWQLKGNAGTNPTNNFIGTTDAQDVVMRANNTERFRLLNTGGAVINYPDNVAGANYGLRINSTYGLYVNANNQTTANGSAPAVYIEKNSTLTNVRYPHLRLDDTRSGSQSLSLWADDAAKGYINTYNASTNTSAGSLILQQGASSLVGIGNTSPAYKLDVAAGGMRNEGVLHTGKTGSNLRQHLGIANYSECVGLIAYSSFLIQTTIPYTNGADMPMLRVWGTAYFEGTLDLSLVWYVWTGVFNTYNYTNSGTWQPSRIRLANVGGFVAIEIEDSDGLYCPKFTLDAFDQAPDAYHDGWTITQANLPATATNIVTVTQGTVGNVNAKAWLQDGNTNSSLKSIGTKDNFSLPFITNNTEKMRLTTAGKLGVGTNNPMGMVTVQEEYLGQTIGVFAGGTLPGFVHYNDTDWVGISTIDRDGITGGNDKDGMIYWGDDANDNLRFSKMVYSATGGGGHTRTDYMFMDGNTGNIGINNNTPTARLDVISNNNGVLAARGGHFGDESQIRALGTNGSWNAGYSFAATNTTNRASINMAVANGDMFFNTGGATPSERMRILNNGNVGIGTTTPTAKLDIAGAVKITDGTQGVGRKLTSDATGQASWQPAPSDNVSSDVTLALAAGTATTLATNYTTLQKGVYMVYFYNCLASASANYYINANVQASAGAITVPNGGFVWDFSQSKYYTSTPFVMKIQSATANVRGIVQHQTAGTVTEGAGSCSTFTFVRIAD